MDASMFQLLKRRRVIIGATVTLCVLAVGLVSNSTSFLTSVTSSPQSPETVPTIKIEKDKGSENQVCLATQELDGISPSGGIGKTFLQAAQHGRNLTESLAVLYVRDSPCGPNAECINRAKTELNNVGINFEWIYQKYAVETQQRWHGFWPTKLSHVLFQFLIDNPKKCRTIYFHDYNGLGFYSLLARKTGHPLLRNIRMVAWHTETIWHEQLTNNKLVTDFGQLVQLSMEREALKLASEILTTSATFRTKLSSRLNIPSTRISVLPDLTSEISIGGLEEKLLKRVWFFSSSIDQYGLAIFLKSALIVQENNEQIEINVSIGDYERKSNSAVAALLANKKWKSRPKFHIDGPHHVSERLHILRKHYDTLIVAPLESEVMAHIIDGCIEVGIPVIAPNGHHDHILADPANLFDPNPKSLASQIMKIHKKGLTSLHVQMPREMTSDLWRKTFNKPFHVIDPSYLREKLHQSATCVVITSYNRPGTLMDTIESVRSEAKRYSGKTTIVVADDQSTNPELLKLLQKLKATKDVRVYISAANSYLGALRDDAVSAECGDYDLVTFLDDDDVYQPGILEAYSTAAAANPDVGVFTSFVDTKSHPNDPKYMVRYLTMGHAPEVGIFANMLGAATMAVRKSAFEQLGGFTRLRAPCEDWELLLKASLGKVKLMLVPVGGIFYVHQTNNHRMLEEDSGQICYKRVIQGALPEIGIGLQYAYAQYLKHETNKW